MQVLATFPCKSTMLKKYDVRDADRQFLAWVLSSSMKDPDKIKGSRFQEAHCPSPAHQSLQIGWSACEEKLVDGKGADEGTGLDSVHGIKDGQLPNFTYGPNQCICRKWRQEPSADNECVTPVPQHHVKWTVLALLYSFANSHSLAEDGKAIESCMLIEQEEYLCLPKGFLRLALRNALLRGEIAGAERADANPRAAHPFKNLLFDLLRLVSLCPDLGTVLFSSRLIIYTALSPLTPL